MQKLFQLIVMLIFIFSSINISFAQEGYIEKLLDLNYGPEEYNLELAHLDHVYFNQSETQAYFEQVNNINETLKDQIIQKYRNGELEYNQTQGIISAQKKFVYALNHLFLNIQMKENGENYGELDDSILRNYKEARIYYQKVKQLISKK